jgi:hypothetical protein
MIKNKMGEKNLMEKGKRPTGKQMTDRRKGNKDTQFNVPVVVEQQKKVKHKEVFGGGGGGKPKTPKRPRQKKKKK